jgi:branched-chain amino acid transport system permease protein
MLEFIQHIVNGLSLGSIYALIALGYTMVFGILQMINFAHADVYMLGAFIGMYFSRYMELDKNPSFGALVAVMAIAMAGCAVIGFLIERFAYRKLRNSPRINVLITAFIRIGSQVFSANLSTEW